MARRRSDKLVSPSGRRIGRLVDGVLEYVEQTGLEIGSAEAAEMLESRAAIVMPDKRHVRIPAPLMKSVLDECPRKFKVYDRNGKRSVTLGHGAPSLAAAAGADRAVTDSGDSRVPELSDLVELSVLSQNLEELQLQGSATRVYGAPVSVAGGLALLACFGLGSKPVIARVGEPDKLRLLKRICSAVAGSEARLRKKPLVMVQVSPLAERGWDEASCHVLLGCARSGIPVLIAPVPPASAFLTGGFASGFVRMAATALVGAALCQLAEPGAGLVVGAGHPGPGSTTDTPSALGHGILMGICVADAAARFEIPTALSLASVWSAESTAWAGQQGGLGLGLADACRPALMGGLGGLAEWRGISAKKLILDCRTARALRQTESGLAKLEALAGGASGAEQSPTPTGPHANGAPRHRSPEEEIQSLLSRPVPSGMKRWLVEDVADMLSQAAAAAGSHWALSPKLRDLLLGDASLLGE